MEIATSPTPTSSLPLSPFTPSLTYSPTISSTTASSPLLPEFFPKEIWPLVDISPFSLSSSREHSPSVILVNSEPDLPPKKKYRCSAKLEHDSVDHVFQTTHTSPAVVAIPPAQASDIPHDLTKKPSRKRPSPSTGHSKFSKRKSSPPPPPQQPASQPIRYRFVSVQHTENIQPDVHTEFEEHMEAEMDDGPFEHGPTEFPPRAYPGGEYAVSPWQPPLRTGKIPASSLDFLPVLEARFSRLENAIKQYVELRARQALDNSILPEAQSESRSAHRALRAEVLSMR